MRPHMPALLSQVAVRCTSVLQTSCQGRHTCMPCTCLCPGVCRLPCSYPMVHCTRPYALCYSIQRTLHPASSLTCMARHHLALPKALPGLVQGVERIHLLTPVDVHRAVHPGAVGCRQTAAAQRPIGAAAEGGVCGLSLADTMHVAEAPVQQLQVSWLSELCRMANQSLGVLSCP